MENGGVPFSVPCSASRWKETDLGLRVRMNQKTSSPIDIVRADRFFNLISSTLIFANDIWNIGEQRAGRIEIIFKKLQEKTPIATLFKTSPRSLVYISANYVLLFFYIYKSNAEIAFASLRCYGIGYNNPPIFHPQNKHVPFKSLLLFAILRFTPNYF